MTVRDETGAGGRIITFYSYKGGTGRTMALANVAWLLASNGYKVLTIDWDLESPGLHRYFYPFLRDRDLTKTDGILDLMREYADATLRPNTTNRDLDAMANIQNYAVSLEWEFPQGGLVDFVHAGRQGLGYTEAVSTFDWDAFWRLRRGAVLIDRLRDDLAQHYDFVLIDSRTGMSDTAGICTIRLPDTVVNCFTLNTQSIDGAIGMTASIQEQSNVRVYPLPTRIEDGEKAKLDRGRVYSRRRFEPYMTFLDGQSAAKYWNAVEVPYIPYYAYEEVLAVFGDAQDPEGGLLGRYVRLAGLLTDRPCPAPAISDVDRTRVLEEFEQTVPRERRTVLVAYAPLDRIWAEWLRDRLGGGNQVVLHNIRGSLPDLDGTDRVVIIYSRDFVTQDESATLLRTARDRVTHGEPNFAIALRVDATVVDQRMPPHAVVDVMGIYEERALQMLAGALALDWKTVTMPDATAIAIRYPGGDLPRYWNLELTRNTRFSGRGRLIEAIREKLVAAGPDGARIALTGVQGVGKTQTALEYVYRFAVAYEAVWWISVTQPARVRVALSDLATTLELPGGNVEEQVATVQAALRRGSPVRRWLVVFDNADVPADFTNLLPSGPGHVLVTSRNPTWSNTLDTFDIQVFKRHESLELLERRVPGLPAADADLLAGRLGDLPLALEQAGGTLASTGMTVGDYIGLLDNSVVQTMEEGSEGQPTTIASTVEVAFEELTRRSPAAARLLELFSFMAPEAIPYRIISNKQLTAVLSPIDARMYDPNRRSALIREIGRLGLARTDPSSGGVVVHRLTQDIVRTRLAEPELAERRREIQSVLADADRRDPAEKQGWGVYEGLRPHLEPTGALSSDQPETRQLIIDMTTYLRQRGDYESCREFAGAVLEEWLPLFQEDVWVLRLRRELAIALRDQGRESDAYEMNRHSLERLRELVGDDDLYTLQTATSFGADLRARGEYAEAVELDEATCQGLTDAYGDTHLDTVMALSNLAVCLEIRRSTLVAPHMGILTSQENLGTDLREIGDLRDARNQFEDAFDSIREAFGEGHMRTLRLASGYVVTLRRLNEMALAADIIDDVARRAEVVLGSRHRVALNCRLEQAAVRWAEGKHEEAHKAAEEIYVEYRDQLGYRHPETLAAGNNLTIFRRADGDIEGALRLAEKTHTRFESALLTRHPSTLASLVTLANAQFDAGSRSAARNTDDQVLGRLRKSVREGHPTLLAAMVNWAVTHRTEDEPAADRMLGEALEGLQTIYDDGHPSIEAAEEWRRIDVDIAPIPF
jgi:cellulose biosynthesis protein BcsQ